MNNIKFFVRPVLVVAIIIILSAGWRTANAQTLSNPCRNINECKQTIVRLQQIVTLLQQVKQLRAQVTVIASQSSQLVNQSNVSVRDNSPVYSQVAGLSPFCPSFETTPYHATIVAVSAKINGVPLVAGDAISAYDAQGHCYGSAEVPAGGGQVFLNAYGDDGSGTDNGFVANEQVILKFYQASSGKEFIANSSPVETVLWSPVGNFFLVLEYRAALPSALLSSNPPNGALDARRGVPAGQTRWQNIDLTFSSDASSVTLNDFIIEGNGGPGLRISEVRHDASTPNKVTVVITRPLVANERVTVVYKPSRSSICLGVLPGDVDQSQQVAPADILQIIDVLNNVAPGPEYLADIDGSGQINDADRLAVIDILQTSNGKRALTCPAPVY